MAEDVLARGVPLLIALVAFAFVAGMVAGVRLTLHFYTKAMASRLRRHPG